ncbi:hypothetical protein IFM89_008028 [Coptis chinensis]|uniref:DELLA protein RGL1 n=1 Tax=Coptis chinensis TaxID=261450 RepID=A0A835LV95_9MAGN|nr:hypothetical protein IFM89_008028 [Coptis chinensis]
MANVFFSFEPFESSAFQNGYDSLQGDMREGLNKRKQAYSSAVEGCGVTDHITYKHGFNQHKAPEETIQISRYHEEMFSDFEMLDETVYSQSSQESPKLESILHEISDIAEHKKEQQISLASLKLLSNYRSELRRSNEDKLNKQRPTSTTADGRRLSTEEVLRVAGARYIQLFVEKDDDLSMLGHPFGCALFGLSDEEIKDVELVHFLLGAVEKVGNKQFERASKLLSQCYYLASNTGNPVQRVVYYFAEALQERIDRETGRTPFGKRTQDVDVEEAMMSLNPAIMGYYQRLPFSQMLQVAGTQAIMENIGLAKRVHLIDLSIRTGMQWIVLMHALAARSECPVELFKVTAIGTTSQQTIEETGRRLSGFAETINLPFSFKVVMVSHMKDIKEDLFELQAEEAVAVFSPMVLRTMIAQPDHLEDLMKAIKHINPCIMVISEMEADHNSPIFVSRFVETLFFYGAFFDSFDACTDRDDQNRMMAEKIFSSQAIRNIVATEGQERTIRHVGINVWRAFFSQFEMVETELSESSLYQARLVLEKFACASSCSLDMKGKCLTMGWKGTPFHSLSAWKFHQSDVSMCETAT